ncbi:recombinase family protein [Persicitalea sp.]|uniref:recombinase family protein n=1 Tax=Persicitalea sp. TaxID=3100273 RepID=UPI0035944309
MKFVCYYRVSTKGQGRSGLGLGDQRSIVERYLRNEDELLGEFTEIESGRKGDRPKLQEAIRACQQHRAKLLIAKLDRLSRNVGFVMTLRDSGVDFVACDLPDANTLTVGMMVTFAQYEAERTSERTRAALAQKKAQGFKLGKPENLTPAAIERGRLVRTTNARQNKANVQATELAQFYRSAGLTYAQIADRLNRMHYLTRRSKSFEGKAVYRLLKRQEQETGVAVGADTDACD